MFTVTNTVFAHAQPSDFPSTSPSSSPSISALPSYSPSVSLAPSMDRFSLVSSSLSSTVTAAFGVMFEVEAQRAITVETFAVKHFSNSISGTATFHIFYKVQYVSCFNHIAIDFAPNENNTIPFLSLEGRITRLVIMEHS